MHSVDQETVRALAAAMGTEPDAIVEEMDAKADEEGFPTVGPEVGGWLRLLTAAVDAERVFEFGSGYGYSAYWFAGALPADGELVLTEIDADELQEAREYMARGGYSDLARFEHGDAIETIERYEGPFDVVLIDNEKDRYAEAFEAVRGKVPVGGLVCADNMLEGGSIDAGDVTALLAGGEPETDEMSRGIATYIDRIRDDLDFETGLLPLGEGVAVSLRTAR